MSETTASCGGCGSADLRIIFEMPQIPASVGSLPNTAAEASQAACGAIRLAACPACGLIQNQLYDVGIAGFVPGYEVSLFHTPTFRRYIQGVCDRLIERYELRGKDILEIGCGGGEFLRLICETGGNRGVGVDPTVAAEHHQQVGSGSVRLIPGYFGKQHDRYIGDFVCCLSVFEDIPRPLDFLSSLRESIGDRDVPIYFEVFNGFRSIQQREVWSIHYEQCNYFSLESFTGLFRRAGFEVTEANPCYQGDQYLYVEARPDRAPTSVPSCDFAALMPTVEKFAEEYRNRRESWSQRLDRYRAENKTVVVWGSGGKGITFLSSLPAVEMIEYVVDVNPDRQNRFIPLTGQAIIDPARLHELQPDVVILTNALYQKEITQQLDGLGIDCEILVA
jgi:hypothetical protein